MICWIGACAFGVDARPVHIPARCGCDGPGLGRSPTPLSVDDCGFFSTLHLRVQLLSGSSGERRAPPAGRRMRVLQKVGSNCVAAFVH